MDIANLNIEELKRGYVLKEGRYVCCICGEEYEKGEVFIISNRFYEAERAVQMHIQIEHGGIFTHIISSDKKYTGLTDNQREIMKMMYEGMTDKEIAVTTNTAQSTVRHQRFMFRERAKQARLYLAAYELACAGKRASATEEQLMEVHGGATMVDERYSTTKSEEEKICETFFESDEPIKLKVFPARDKKKIVVLKRIAEEFEKGRDYSEKEVNEILKNIYYDYVTLRRYLIEYGFLDRSRDCSLYRLKWNAKKNIM